MKTLPGGVIRTREQAIAMRCARAGKLRNAFWAKLGHPNLIKATTTHMANAARRRAEKAAQVEAQAHPKRRGRKLPL